MIHKLFPQLSPVRLGISEKVGRGKRPQLTSKMPCHSLKKKWRKPASGYSESRIRPHDCTNLLHARSHETQHKGNIRRDNHILIMHGCSRGHNNLASRSQEPSDVQKPAKRGNRARSMTERNSPCEASEASWTRGAEGDRRRALNGSSTWGEWSLVRDQPGSMRSPSPGFLRTSSQTTFPSK